MNKRPTVWVLKEQVIRDSTGSRPMDYTPAYEYGDIRFITEFDPSTHEGSSIDREWRRHVAKFVDEFDPQRDSLILTGSPLAIARFGRIIGETAPLIPVRVLVWKRDQNRYVPTAL